MNERDIHHYKSFSGLKKQMQELLCDSLRDRITYFYTTYHEVHNAYGRASVNLDGEEMASFTWNAMYEQERDMGEMYRSGNRVSREEMMQNGWMEHGILCESDFLRSMTAYLNTDVTEALHSDNLLLRMFAFLDRRIGKRTLTAIKDEIDSLPDWVARFYRIRCEAEGIS